MKAIESINRRQFLSLTGLTAGGLILMATLPQSSALASVLAEPRGALLNIFVSINASGNVDIIAHRSEMGTGIRTSLPQVVADEMEADWQRVTVIQGLANAEYGSQNTDGSRSVRDFYHTMRVMGATARQMLETAAAQHWGVPVRECQARKHAVHYKGQSLSFGDLAEVASQLPPPKANQLVLKSKKQFNYIGKDIPIVDLEDMTTGNTVYGIDVHLPGMVYASIERTPVLEGQIRSYDTGAAKKVKGVVDVIEIKGKPLPPHFNPLEGVAVIATNTHTAIKARKQLNTRWQSSPHDDHSSSEYLNTLMARVTTKSGEVFRQRGDVDKALKQADQQIEASYKTPYLAHAPMEPPMATAHIHDGICEIWACTQAPQVTQQTVANTLGLKPEQVKVHVTLLGGGFGRKSKADYSAEAAVLAKQTGKPVQVVWTREDDIQHDYYHACAAQYYKAGLDSNGMVTSWLAREASPPIASTFIANANTMDDGTLGMSFGSIPFVTPNIRLERHPADAHVRIGWLRSVYNVPFGFGVGCFVGELAHAAGKDPKAFWLELIGPDRKLDFAPDGYTFSNYGRSLQDYPYDTGRLKNTLTTLCDSIPWGKKLPAGQGWGITVLRSFLSYVAAASKVEIKGEQLTVKEMHCVIDCGTVVNPDRVHAQLEGAMIFGCVTLI